MYFISPRPNVNYKLLSTMRTPLFVSDVTEFFTLCFKLKSNILYFEHLFWTSENGGVYIFLMLPCIVTITISIFTFLRWSKIMIFLLFTKKWLILVSLTGLPWTGILESVNELSVNWMLCRVALGTQIAEPENGRFAFGVIWLQLP